MKDNLSPDGGETGRTSAASGAAKPKQKVLLVDDHPLVREWLANLINQQSDFEVCGEAANASQALQLIAACEPRIAVVDISLDGASGIDLIKEIKAAHSGVLVVVLTMHDEALYAERALRAGARGYIMKREATQNVLKALRQVLAGGLYLSEKMTALMAEKFIGGRPASPLSPLTALSDRELEVFELLGLGHSTREIAAKLNLSFKTIQTFRERIKEKLNLGGATELLREAVLWLDNRRSR